MHFNYHNSNLQKLEPLWDRALGHWKNFLGLLNLSFTNVNDSGMWTRSGILNCSEEDQFSGEDDRGV